ncbi:MAG: hypothetical protein JW843_04410, partial [Candidatus Aminicenantes bacterium]|nr:hypothetical protein [Candidatus Aminicenantes bacterium]
MNISIPKRIFVPALALFAFFGSVLFGRDGGGLSFSGSVLWTKAQDVEIRGNLAYCAFQNGLRILDITQVTRPILLSEIHLGGGYAVALSGDMALVAAAEKGLAVIDASDPKKPVLKSVFDTPGEARDVAVDGTTAFVADYTEGLLAVDFADPASPKAAGAWNSPGEALGLKLRGKTVFLADGAAGLQTVDASSPGKLVPLGSLDTDGTAESLALADDYAYIADGPGGIKTVDIRDAAKPKQTNSLTASGYARSAAVEGSVLCVGSLYDGGYQLLDISNPAAPAVASTNKYTMYNEGWNVRIFGNRGVVVDYFSGVFFLNFSDIKKPSILGRFFTPSSIVSVCGKDNLAFAVGELSGVQSVDLTDPARPVSLGGSSIFRGVQNIAVAGNTVYVTDRWSIKSFDVADPAKPRPGKPLTFTEGIPRTLVIRENTGFLTADNFGFYTIDFSNPAGLKVLGSFKLPGFTYGLAVSGDFAYLSNSDTGLHVLDIRKPEAPVEVAVLRLAGEPSGLAVRDKRAYIASGGEGLIIVDISNPKEMKTLGTVTSDDFSSAV